MTATGRTSDTDLTAKWADIYRSRGFNPLPSDPRPTAEGGRKKPLVAYRRWWEAEAPADLFDHYPTTNIQVMTGRYWRLLVIDLDGPEAIAHWPTMGQCPATWTVASGNGGMHLWFRLSSYPPDPLPKARLWGEWDESSNEGKGDWKPRKAIERLCDRSLVMAPPSVHPKTGLVYQWVDKFRSPIGMQNPAYCPAWVLKLPALSAPRPEAPSVPDQPRKERTAARHCHLSSSEVLATISDKLAIAQGWGLRLAGTAHGGDGWVSCRALHRPDNNPSCRFNVFTGRFVDFAAGENLSLFDLGAALCPGQYADWRECRDALAEQFGLVRSNA